MALDSIHQRLAPGPSSEGPRTSTSAAPAFPDEAVVSVTVTTAGGLRGIAMVHSNGSFSFHQNYTSNQPVQTLWSRLPCLWGAVEVPSQVWTL